MHKIESLLLTLTLALCAHMVQAQAQPAATDTDLKEDVEARERWFTDQRRYPFAQVPAGARLQAFRQMEAMQSRKSRGASVAGAPRWEAIGPGNGGGRVRAIAVGPGNVVYIGAAAGGVWSTTNGGAAWATTFDTQPSLAMGSLCIDPANPLVIYAGTGENTNNSDSYSGAGVMKSTDGGLTWKSSGLANVGACSRIAVSTANPKIVYAAATKSNAGFYRSSDAGATWTRVINNTCFDMSVSPLNSDIIFIGTNNGVMRSLDGGATFTTQVTGITGAGGSTMQRVSVAVAPSDTNIAWCLVSRTGGANGNIAEIYMTRDQGNTWELRGAYPTGSFFNSQGWYDNAITVHPTKPYQVLAAGIDVYMTTDTGATWTNTTKSYSGGNVHPDQHTLTHDPARPNDVYLGNDGGVYKSTNAGSAWTKISTQLPVTQFYRMEVDQTRPYRVYGGSQDNGSYGSFGATGFTQTWTKVLGGDGFYVAVDQSNPDIIYAENFNGSPLSRINVAGANPSGTRIDAGVSESGLWSSPIATSPADKKTLYSGRRNLWRTSNPGTGTAVWQKLTAGNASSISCIGLSRFDTALVAIGSSSGEVYATTDGGANWVKSTGGPNRYVTSMVYDPAVAGRLYATFSGYGSAHVYRSDDSGATMASISGNLPNVPVNSIAVDPANNQRLYIGTDVGVFASPDAGLTWVPFNDGIALSPVVDVRVHASTRSLVAATHGRSMFRISIDQPLTGLEQQNLSGNTLANTMMITSVSPNPAWAACQVVVSVTAPQRLKLELFNADGTPVQVVADAMSGQGNHIYGISTAALPSGVYYLRLQNDAGDRQVKTLTVVH